MEAISVEEQQAYPDTKLFKHELATRTGLPTRSQHELDLTARMAGMTLGERWSDWNREPFTAESSNHVSVRNKPSSDTVARPVSADA